MTFIRACVAAVYRNRYPVLLYAAVAVGGGVLLRLGALALGEADVPKEGPVPFSLRLYALVGQLVLAFALAAIQAVVFSRMGKEIDRPLWRVADDRDALRRFFQLWLILNLASVAVSQLMHLAGRLESAGLLELSILLDMLVFVLSVPVGACIMFAGALVWKEIGKDLAPLLEQLPRTLSLLLINLIMYGAVWVLLFYGGSEPGTLAYVAAFAGLGFVSVLVDAVVFAGTWHICIEHRNTDQDVDFDF